MSSLGQVYYEPRSKPLNSNGVPVPGGTLTFYQTGTTTYANIYQDIGLTTTLPNPVTADGSGLFPVIYTDPSVLYRVILKTAGGVTLEDTDGWTGLTTVVVMYGPAKSDIFTGDGVTTTFTLSAAPGGTSNTDVSLDGATLLPVTDYSVSGTSMSLTNAPVAGQKLLARYGVPVAAGFATPYYGITNAETTASVVPTDYSVQATETFAYIARYNNNLVTALSVASTNPFTIYIDRPITLAANATVLATTTLVFVGNGSISVSNTFTLTVQGPVVAPGLAQSTIFTGVGTTTISTGSVTGLTVIGPTKFVGTTTVLGTFTASSITAAPTVQGAYKNLSLSATGLSATTTVTADELVLENGSNAYINVKPVSLSISNAASGANGLDTGTVAASTWYSVWVISDGTNIAGLLSLSATSPTMPGLYTYKARVGWVRTDSTANKYPLTFLQNGRKFRYKPTTGSNLTTYPLITSATTGTINSTTFAGTATSISNFFPLSTVATVTVQLGSAGAGAAAAPSNTYGGWTSTTPAPCALVPAGYTSPQTYEFIPESTNIYFASTGVAVLQAIGWEDNL